MPWTLPPFWYFPYLSTRSKPLSPTQRWGFSKSLLSPASSTESLLDNSHWHTVISTILKTKQPSFDPVLPYTDHLIFGSPLQSNTWLIFIVSNSYTPIWTNTGFHLHHVIKTLTVKITSDLHNTKSNGQFSVLIFLDLAAASDHFLTWPLRQSLGFLFPHG